MVPSGRRYIVLALGGWIFYAWASPLFLIGLALVTGWTYLGGHFLTRQNTTVRYVVFFTGNILILGVYKYTAFILGSLQSLHIVGGMDGSPLMNIAAPVGLSFMIFQTCTYLGDVHHARAEAERDVVRYAAFVSFFPTVLSGPIQRSRDLLPQIRQPAAFDADVFIRGILFFLWGVFEKVCVANRLSVLVGDPPEGIEAGAAWYLVSAIAFSLYIYADFSGYSDMAIGLARMLGIHVGRNFNNPYLSRSLSEFWNRWHMSLSAWLIEYIYIPFGGNRKGTLRKYINVMIVFLLSGLWHGANWHFVVWGGLNGALVILAQILRPVRKQIAEVLGFREDSASLRFVQRVIVFVLITGTWLFFAHGVGIAVNMIRTMATAPLSAYLDPALWYAYGSASHTAVVILCTAVFLILQCKRNERSNFANVFVRQPLLAQWVVLGSMVVVCLFVYCAGYATVNTSFIYFQF